ncbi:MAG: DUF4252 domain-containing protein [Bacteroidales bacterium]
MKTLFGTLALLLFTCSLNAQRSIDALFDKYAGKDGFVTVRINGSLLKLAAALDNDEDDEEDPLPKNISQIRILATEDDNLNVENFYDMVMKDIDLSKYEEFMQVKESDQDIRMLVRMEGKVFTEFLLVIGGKDNAIIQIKGSMTVEEARKFAADAKKDHGSDLIKN